MLDSRAERWNKGSVVLYHANPWLMDQIRERQMHQANVSDANGCGVRYSPWQDVHSGCLGHGSWKKEGVQDINYAGHCHDPETFLFW